MTNKPSTCPMTRAEIVDRYFLEHRARLIDVAAFFDRFDRAKDAAGGGARAKPDFRVEALRKAAAILAEREAGRAARILELLSDPTDQPIASAAGLKGAYGAWPGPPARDAPGRVER
jgi:hypothetical protein